MDTYYFESPILKRSTKPFPILNERKEIIGYMQRYYESKWSYLLDAIVTNMFLHVKAETQDGTEVCNVKENVKLKDFVSYTRQNWAVTSAHETFTLHDKTKIKTHPRYTFCMEGMTYTLQKKLGDFKVCLQNERNEKVVEATFNKLIPPQTFTVQLYKDELNPFVAICLVYIFLLRD